MSRQRCQCGAYRAPCGACGRFPGQDVIDARRAQVAALEARIARLKDSIASHERAEKLAFDRYVRRSAEAAGL